MNADTFAPTAFGLQKAVIYIRVSSEEQVENYSLGTQEEICRREAKNKGFEIVQVFREEGKSAKTIIGRPVLLELLEFCRKNRKEVRALFVYRVDRLSRQTADFLAIRKKLTEYNIALFSANEPTGNSPTEKLLETILASFAQHDNDVRSERTKNGMRARFLSGLITHHAPLGYLNQHGYAAKDPETFELYKKAWDLMATGTKSLREMTVIMGDWGIKIANQTLQQMFRNKFYMGYLISKSYPEAVRGQHTPMVTEEQFYRVQAILDGRNPNKLLLSRKSRDNPEFPLRRIVRCSKCGTPFTGAWSRGHGGKYSYYFCRKRCVGKSVSVGTLDDDLKGHLKRYSPTEEGLRLYCDRLRRTYNKKLTELQKSQKQADGELQKLYGLRQTLVEKNLNGTYSDDIFKEQNAVIEEKIIAAQTAKNDALVDKYDIDKIIAFTEEKLKDLAATYADSRKKKNLSQIRCLLGSIFMSGFSWGYPGCSNFKISPIYQEILDADDPTAVTGDPTGS